MNLAEAFIIAFSMYSKIPMPRVEWQEKNMKYAMCFFPAVGVIIGIIEFLVGYFLYPVKGGTLFFSALMTLIPVLITGGIHLDGYMDTMDALASWGEKEKKLEILKDSHAGAFAVLGLGIYLTVSLAVWSEVTEEMLPVIACGYVLSRALSGFSVVAFRAARENGLVKTFQDRAAARTVRIVMCVWMVLAVAVMCAMHTGMGILSAVCAAAVFFYYRKMSDHNFGGVTGDLAGYFLTLCELGMQTALVIVYGMILA